MISRFAAGVATLSLCLGSATPTLAQDHRFAGWDGARGTNATINLRIPLGAPQRRSRPTLGLTVGFGQTLGAGIAGEPIVRQVRVADFRFSADGLENARVASFDLAHLDRDRRLNLGGSKKTSLLLVGAAAAAAAAVCLAAGCFDDDDDEETPGDSGNSPTNPG
jgi:hypothetical protein